VHQLDLVRDRRSDLRRLHYLPRQSDVRRDSDLSDADLSGTADLP
jgi:hypothetical protein